MSDGTASAGQSTGGGGGLVDFHAGETAAFSMVPISWLASGLWVANS